MNYSRNASGIPARKYLIVLITICVVILSYLIIVQTWLVESDSPTLILGDVAQQDLRAPRNIEYISEVLTDEARAEAERSIEPVYGSPDQQIARGQLEILQSVLDTISKTRQNVIATRSEKQAALEAIEYYQFSQESLYSMLALSDERWSIVKQEAYNVLENVMRSAIRTDSLQSTMQDLPSRISLALYESEVNLVVELISPLVAANSFYSPELTEAARNLARDSVEPVLISYIQGEMIVSSGHVISPTAYEALIKQNLIAKVDYKDKFIGAAGVVILGLVIILLSFIRRRMEFVTDLRSLLLFAFSFLGFLAIARFSIPNHAIVPYLIPLAAFGLLISTLFGMSSSIAFSLVLVIFTVYGLPNALELFSYYFLASMSAVLTLGNGRRISHFLWASGVIAGVGMIALVSYRLPVYTTDLVGLATLAGAAVVNGIASSSLALLMQFLLAQFLGLTTAMQLLEISRPDFPLLKEFLLKAPGTYQHSLQVSNLAEQAAERIGADVLLTRVGALYHDVGKSPNASYFIENQVPGNINSHDELDPRESAAIIIAHVTDGFEMAKKYRLPSRVQDFILEHHGTMIPRYQYNRAVELADGDKDAVDIEDFQYPGPTPQSRETALLMFADGVEATVRAKQPKTESELRAIIQEVVDKTQYERQLVDTPLTQKDITTIIESFVSTLQGVFHPRLEYPQPETVELPILEDPAMDSPDETPESTQNSAKTSRKKNA
ncbi:HD family phosphohydrolase [Chloroflexota bacterium]